MKGQLLNKMLVLTTNAHADQYDKGGNPYILHPLKVMHYLKTDDVELQCIALGHDIIEDTKVTYADLRDQGVHSSNYRRHSMPNESTGGNLRGV